MASFTNVPKVPGHYQYFQNLLYRNLQNMHSFQILSNMGTTKIFCEMTPLKISCNIVDKIIAPNDVSVIFFYQTILPWKCIFRHTQTQNFKNYTVPKDNSRLILEFDRRAARTTTVEQLNSHCNMKMLRLKFGVYVSKLNLGYFFYTFNWSAAIPKNGNSRKGKIYHVSPNNWDQQ